MLTIALIASATILTIGTSIALTAIIAHMIRAAINLIKRQPPEPQPYRLNSHSENESPPTIPEWDTGLIPNKNAKQTLKKLLATNHQNDTSTDWANSDIYGQPANSKTHTYTKTIATDENITIDQEGTINPEKK